MSYSTSNPPVLITQGLMGSAADGSRGSALWVLAGTDATTDVDASGYITNARDLGLKKGDTVIYTKTDASPISVNSMVVAAINTNGSADLEAAVTWSGANSD